MFTYTLTTDGVIARSDGAIIPMDQANPDYLTFLEWLAAGNTPASPSPPSTIPASDFLARFTSAEQTAVQTACFAAPPLQVALTMGLAQGYINLTSPLLAAWMAALVTAGALTSARSAILQTP